MSLLVMELGRTEYVRAWRAMRIVHMGVSRGLIGDALILTEHEPVITVGKHGRTGNVLAWDIPVYVVERGGDATYHGPGQLIGYPVVRARWPIKTYLNMLEDVIIRALAAVGVEANRRADHRGVWSKGKKVASIGVAVEGGATLHGFAVYVHGNVEDFRRVNPCGLHFSQVTTLRELGHNVTMEELKRGIVSAFGDVFGLKPVWTHYEDVRTYLGVDEDEVGGPLMAPPTGSNGCCAYPHTSPQ